MDQLAVLCAAHGQDGQRGMVAQGKGCILRTQNHHLSQMDGRGLLARRKHDGLDAARHQPGKAAQCTLNGGCILRACLDVKHIADLQKLHLCTAAEEVGAIAVHHTDAVADDRFVIFLRDKLRDSNQSQPARWQ